MIEELSKLAYYFTREIAYLNGKPTPRVIYHFHMVGKDHKRNLIKALQIVEHYGADWLVTQDEYGVSLRVINYEREVKELL